MLVEVATLKLITRPPPAATDTGSVASGVVDTVMPVMFTVTVCNVYFAVVADEELPAVSQAMTAIEVPGAVAGMLMGDPTVPVEQVGAEGGVKLVAMA
ncbi:MAG: hypothetical protein EBU92_14665 [Betaproteobacteria bacterium]|nr:hypothetical protein [Betaproteobacteria bacterium]